jgi:transposase
MNVLQRVSYHLTHEEAIQALALLQDGRSQRYVARVLGVNHSTIVRLAQRHQETGSVDRRPGQGRRRVTSVRDDRFLRLTALRSRHCTARLLQSEMLAARDVEISLQTVRNRLREDNIRAHVPARAPQLTRQHRVARLAFAREHVNWDIGDWQNVMFSDESRFCLYEKDRRMPVYRRPGERYLQCNFVPNVNYGGGSVMVWGAISVQGRTELVSLRYITDILDPHVIPYSPFIGPNFVNMHDNARPHTARIVQEYLRETETPVMEWPARSPDLNPIEHVWDTLQQRVLERRMVFRTLQQLEVVLVKEWHNIPLEYIVNLYESMLHRMEAVIQARGGSTRF